MALVRAIPLKDFTATSNPLSTSGVGSVYSTQLPLAGQRAIGVLHLTGVSTGRTFAGTIQSASSSGFGTPTTEFVFALSSEVGSTWQTLASPSTDRAWRRAKWTLSTAASTGGTWNGLFWVGFSNQ